MAPRSKPRRTQRRRRSSGIPVFLFFLAVAASLVWLAWKGRKPADLDDRVIEMIRENPAAEVLAPSPAEGNSPPAGAPEAFEPGGPAPRTKSRR